MADFGQDPADPLNALPIARVVVMNPDGSYVEPGNDEAPKTPSIIRATGPGNIPAGASSVHVKVTGAANATFLGQVVKVGEEIYLSANGATFGALAYDGTGSELLIVTVA